MKISPIVAAAMLTVSPAWAAADETAPAETFIPDISSNGIIEWKADGRRGLYIKAIDGKYYYARTLGPCGRLESAISLGFVTSALDQLDRHGAILAEGWRCPIASLVLSPPPPKKKRG